MGCRVTDRAKEDEDWGMRNSAELCSGECEGCPHQYEGSKEMDYGIVLNIEKMTKLIEGKEVVIVTRDGKKIGIKPTYQWNHNFASRKQ